jgi:predicted RNase H-like HicB family nuclease
MAKTHDHLLVYNVHLEPEPEGGFTVTVPTLPGCVTWGRDYRHALEMAEDAIQCVLASMAKAGEAIPEEQQPLPDVSVRVALPEPY